jgi:hypothetical protein
MDDFTGFWKAYPRKDDKEKARRAWKRLTKAERASATTDAPRRYAKTERQFIPLPSTYLNGKRFNDETASGNQPPKRYADDAAY